MTLCGPVVPTVSFRWLTPGGRDVGWQRAMAAEAQRAAEQARSQEDRERLERAQRQSAYNQVCA